MSDCNKFTDLISGKEHKYSDDKVAELKAKYNKEGLKRVMLYKKYCVLGQIKHYNEYLIEKGLKKAPAGKGKGVPKKQVEQKKAAKKSPAKKVKLPKCVEAGCPSSKTCNVKSGRCVVNKPKGADLIEVGGDEFFVSTSSQQKKVEDFKGAKASPKKKVSVPKSKSPKKKSPAKKGKASPKKKVKVSPKKKTPAKRSPGKKSPPKKVKVPKCLESGCPSGKTCNVKTGNCVKGKPKGARKIEVGNNEFFVTTSSQKKKVEDYKGKKASPAKKVSVPKTKSPKKKSPAKKGKKSPPKKVKVPKCLESGCPGGKTCNVKTGNCVKAKPKGAEKYEYDGEEFFVTTSSQKKVVRDVKGSVSKSTSKSSASKRPSSGMRSARTPSPLVERLVAVSESVEIDDDDETVEVSEELIDLSEDLSEEDDEEEEDAATISREEVATINAQKKMILDILDKCK